MQGCAPATSQHPRKWRLVGVAVSTTDSESVDRGSNPRRAFEFVKLEESHMSLATNFLFPIQNFSKTFSTFAFAPVFQGWGTGVLGITIFLRNKTAVENGDGPPSRSRQGRARAADGLRTRASLIACSRNCQPASPPGLQPPPFVRGAPSPLLLAPQTARCACSRHKNVRGGTDALRSCGA